jgi:hypothetical protein
LSTSVPNVFVQQACRGSHSDARKAWVKPLPQLNGLSPAEAWSNPMALLSAEDLAANPEPGALTICALRPRIIRTVLGHLDREPVEPDPFAGRIPDFSDLVTEAPAPEPEPEDRLTAMVRQVRSQMPPNGNGNNGHAAVSRLVEDIRRRKASRKFR